MITRLLTLLVVFCCFSFSSNAQTIIDGDPTALNLSDDSWTNVDLGFDVTYFGQTFDSISVYTNGMALFGDNRGYADNCCNGHKPTQDQHDYGIFPFWTDLVTINSNDEYNGVYYLGDGVDTFQIGWINIQEFYNNQTNNTFGLEIKSTSTGASIDFFYDELDIQNHSIWSGLTGDVSGGEVIENFFHNQQNGMFTGDSSLDWSHDMTSIDCSNPLNDPSCQGYEEAYTDQQCQQDPMYDQSCSGYEQAYLDQQCSYDPMYDQSCSGYDDAYTDQQCSIDPLWSPECTGYQMAYDLKQCEQDSQSSPTCFNYEFRSFEAESYEFQSFGFEDFSSGDSGFIEFDSYGFERQEFFSEPDPFYEEQFSYERFEPIDEFAFEERFVFEDRFVFEERLVFEERFEEFEELVEQRAEEEKQEKEQELVEEKVEEENIAVAEVSQEPTSQEQATTTRRSGSRVGLSVGLETAGQLVSSLISQSIESGQTDAAQGGFSGGNYFDQGSSGTSAIASGGVNFQNMVNTTTTQLQAEQNVSNSIALPTLSVGLNFETATVTVEVKEPSLAERIAESVRKRNADEQAGIFNKQVSVLESMSSYTNLNNYYDKRLSDSEDWYRSSQIYNGVVMSDNSSSLYRMTSENYGLMKQLVRSQY